MPNVSIIICTYNRSELLRDCLQSLVDQTADKSLYEVVVINNNSTDATLLTAEFFHDKFVHFKVVTEKKQGLSHARNRGWQEASAEWVSYLDDDAKARPDSIERVVELIDSGNFDCFGGRVEPWYKYGKPKWHKADYDNICKSFKSSCVLPDSYTISGGVFMTVKKHLLESSEGFPTHLGMSGQHLGYGEETFVQMKIKKQGCRVGYDPDLIVDHLVGPAKMTPLFFIVSAYKKGCISWMAFDVPVTWGSVFRRLVNSAGSFVVKTGSCLWRCLFEKNFYWQNAAIEGVSDAAYLFGAFCSGVSGMIVEKKTINLCRHSHP